MTREKSGRSGRGLGRNEREEWASFTRAITPLRPAGTPAPPEEAQEPSPAAPDTPPPAEPPKPREQPVPPLTDLDRRLRQRLARGRAGIDARIDLHGLTQAEAHHALMRFLRVARAEGARIVLVITGKGTRGSDPDRGVLRRQVPLWLKSPQLRETVLGFGPAGPVHGGEGAFYVRLRRARDLRG
jgi:DNA-nicking Smr family endonuclease